MTLNIIAIINWLLKA